MSVLKVFLISFILLVSNSAQRLHAIGPLEKCMAEVLKTTHASQNGDFSSIAVEKAKSDLRNYRTALRQAEVLKRKVQAALFEHNELTPEDREEPNESLLALRQQQNRMNQSIAQQQARWKSLHQKTLTDLTTAKARQKQLEEEYRNWFSGLQAEFADLKQSIDGQEEDLVKKAKAFNFYITNFHDPRTKAPNDFRSRSAASYLNYPIELALTNSKYGNEILRKLSEAKLAEREAKQILRVIPEAFQIVDSRLN